MSSSLATVELLKVLDRLTLAGHAGVSDIADALQVKLGRIYAADSQSVPATIRARDAAYAAAMASLSALENADTLEIPTDEDWESLKAEKIVSAGPAPAYGFTPSSDLFDGLSFRADSALDPAKGCVIIIGSHVGGELSADDYGLLRGVVRKNLRGGGKEHVRAGVQANGAARPDHDALEDCVSNAVVILTRWITGKSYEWQDFAGEYVTGQESGEYVLTESGMTESMRAKYDAIVESEGVDAARRMLIGSAARDGIRMHTHGNRTTLARKWTEHNRAQSFAPVNCSPENYGAGEGYARVDSAPVDVSYVDSVPSIFAMEQDVTVLRTESHGGRVASASGGLGTLPGDSAQSALFDWAVSSGARELAAVLLGAEGLTPAESRNDGYSVSAAMRAVGLSPSNARARERFLVRVRSSLGEYARGDGTVASWDDMGTLESVR